MTCEWGRRRVSATAKTCYVVAVARLMDKPRRVVTRSLFILAA
jgi:hypothetical protein